MGVCSTDVHCSHLTTILAADRISFILWIKPLAGQILIKGRIWPAGQTLDISGLEHCIISWIFWMELDWTLQMKTKNNIMGWCLFWNWAALIMLLLKKYSLFYYSSFRSVRPGHIAGWPKDAENHERNGRPSEFRKPGAPDNWTTRIRCPLVVAAGTWRPFPEHHQIGVPWSLWDPDGGVPGRTACRVEMGVWSGGSGGGAIAADICFGIFAGKHDTGQHCIMDIRRACREIFATTSWGMAQGPTTRWNVVVPGRQGN